MTTITTLEFEALSYFQKLTPTQQHAIIALMRSFAIPTEHPSQSLKTLAGSMSVDEALDLKQIIIEDCERIDTHEW